MEISAAARDLAARIRSFYDNVRGGYDPVDVTLETVIQSCLDEERKAIREVYLQEDSPDKAAQLLKLLCIEPGIPIADEAARVEPTVWKYRRFETMVPDKPLWTIYDSSLALAAVEHEQDAVNLCAYHNASLRATPTTSSG